jgi:redox-sensitive bicupin YhaK (pirin superfamily)
VKDAVLEIRRLGFPWDAADPFLFCVHHDDAYPAGNEQFGPAASLHGRDIGQDFAGKDGWRMYHGRVVPGFPQHPHRGFETVTVVRRGLIDHADSMGAAARYGRGDAQWLTAGAGIVHSEMFPLLDRGSPNPVELFQIWLNLPSADKLAPPHFSMLWNESIPRRSVTDAAGRLTEVTLVAGELDGLRPPPPPPRSWASHEEADVAIWCIRIAAGGAWTMPPARRPGVVRTLYFFSGPSLDVAGHALPPNTAARLRGDRAIALKAGDGECEMLLLQGRPIGEPVAAQGPFVMNTRAEIQRAFLDYQQTRFGGWPWPSDDPVHGAENERFAKHADGRVERAADPAPSRNE